jgi:hypothetical protein
MSHLRSAETGTETFGQRSRLVMSRTSDKPYTSGEKASPLISIVDGSRIESTTRLR